MASKHTGFPVGISIGNHFAAIGAVINDRSEIVTDSSGSCVFPFYVSSIDDMLQFGVLARDEICRRPQSVVTGLAALADLDSADIAVPGVDHVSAENDKLNVQLDGTRVPIEHLFAFALGSLRDIAEQNLKQPVHKTVICVDAPLRRSLDPPPKFHSDSQRHVINNACLRAHLENVRTYLTPTCALAAYDVDCSPSAAYFSLVLDVGASSTSVSLLEIGDGLTCPHNYLRIPVGGNDFDAALRDHCALEFCKQHSIDLAALRSNARAMARLTRACEHARCALSMTHNTVVDCASLFHGVDCTLPLSRSQLQNILTPLFAQCAAVVAPVASLQPRLQDVVLTGGCMFTPRLREMMLAAVPVPYAHVLDTIPPNEAAARGAALLGHRLMPTPANVPDLSQCLPLVPLSICVCTADGYAIPVIQRHTLMPNRKERLFALAACTDRSEGGDAPTAIVRICLGEAPVISDNFMLPGECRLRVPQQLATQKACKVAVLLDLTPNEDLIITMTLCASGSEKATVTIPSAAFTVRSDEIGSHAALWTEQALNENVASDVAHVRDLSVLHKLPVA
eukprot:TRINITY_DN5907_c0_g2_i1.p1 TRINITY_DN5907_c0_g2~~TRINITY_DN5907_c0_g2_i1.p1  ORF type:complete len:566 (-),score=83.59 TRINITY_DN5907_c0_g2_i1:1358-3055(-)